MISTDAQSDSQGSDRFATTRWSVVIAAGRRGTDESDDALATLCQTYWYPLYAYVRRRGTQPAAAQDLVQEFFARVIEKEYLNAADQDKGRFRSFLLTVFKRFLANQYQRETADKRGGGRTTMSLDFETGERQFALDAVDNWTPERLFERQWALTLLNHVVNQLADEYRQRGKEDLFQQLKGCLTTAEPIASYQEIAEQMDMTESAVKVAAHRLRSRYRDRLRSEIAHTVDQEDEVDEELNYLLTALRGDGE